MITEETKLERERKFEKINRYFIPAYLLLGVGAAIVNAFRNDVYHFSIGLGTLLIPLALTLFYKIFHLKRVHQVDFWVVLFSLVGYTCGSVLEFYLMIPNFDKVVHTLSGVLVSMLAYALFRAVKPGHAVEKKDRCLCSSRRWQLPECGKSANTSLISLPDATCSACSQPAWAIRCRI